MDDRQSAAKFDEYEIVLIRVKAKSAIGKTGLRSEDLEDIMQDIALDLLQRLPKHDPEKSSRHAFVNRVVDNRLADMLNERSAQKRDYHLNPESLDTMLEKELPEGCNAERSESIDPLHSGHRALSEYELAELRHDIVRALEKMPPKLRSICIMLMHDNICAVASETGIPKATLIGHIKKIRKHFEIFGLENSF